LVLLLSSDLVVMLMFFFLDGMVVEGRRIGQLLVQDMGGSRAVRQRNTWWTM
jgi:hypothetical protein